MCCTVPNAPQSEHNDDCSCRLSLSRSCQLSLVNSAQVSPSWHVRGFSKRLKTVCQFCNRRRRAKLFFLPGCQLPSDTPERLHSWQSKSGRGRRRRPWRSLSRPRGAARRLVCVDLRLCPHDELPCPKASSQLGLSRLAMMVCSAGTAAHACMANYFVQPSFTNDTMVKKRAKTKKNKEGTGYSREYPAGYSREYPGIRLYSSTRVWYSSTGTMATVSIPISTKIRVQPISRPREAPRGSEWTAH